MTRPKTWGVVGSLVTMLLPIFSWFWQWKHFENRLIFDELKAYKKWCYFWATQSLRLFGHVARSDPMQDHTRAISACISNPPRDWRRPRGHPRQTWLRTIEKDLQEQNIGLWTAWFYAQDRVRWRKVVTLQYRGMHATWWWWWCTCRQEAQLPQRNSASAAHTCMHAQLTRCFSAVAV